MKTVPIFGNVRGSVKVFLNAPTIAATLLLEHQLLRVVSGAWGHGNHSGA